MCAGLFEKFSGFMWVLISVIFFLIEIKRKDIFFIYFSLSSLLSCILSIFVRDIEIQLVVFIISSLIFIIFIKIIVDKIIETNFKHDNYIKDKICIILKEENRNLFLYKVISKSGIYTAKYISKTSNPRKFKICNIIHDDGKLIIIK